MRTVLVTFVIMTTLANIAAGSEVIHIMGGNIRNSTPDGDGVRAYKGLPYAAPPIGKLRWHEPVAVKPWKGMRNADHFAPNCVQPKLYADVDPFTPLMSEDCLYLNVWTRAKPNESLPVFVWIHGGGYEVGSGSEPRHDGVALAKKGVVVVTINYRLGPFGFFSHPELSAESTHHSSGNYAVMDMIAALKWVKQNIAAFGGDSDCVTIAGESAGSNAVSVLMASPQAKGLFHRAIGESGSAFAVSNVDNSLQTAEQQGLKFMQAMSTGSLAKLRLRSSTEILSLWKAPDTKWSFRPVVDGWILPSSVADIFKSGKQNDVPLLVGWNSDEGFTFVGRLHDRKLADVLAAQFGSDAAAATRYYPASNADEEKRSRMLYAGDITIAQATWKWAVAQAMTGRAPVYLFQFNHHPLVPDDWFGKDFAVAQSGAFHSAEISYVFNHPEINASWRITADDRKVADEMSSYWIRFMKTGNPNMDGGNAWPTYSLKDPRRMVLSTSSRVEKDNEVERRKFLDTQPAPTDFSQR